MAKQNVDEQETQGKFPLVIGGFIGFLIPFLVTWSSDTSVAIALRNGMIGCIVCAIILSGLFQYMLKSVRDNRNALRRQRELAEEMADGNEEAQDHTAAQTQQPKSPNTPQIT